MARSRMKPQPLGATVSRLPIVILVLVVAAIIAADLFLDLPLSWVDYAAIVVIAGFGIHGHRRGLINSLFGLVGWLAGIVAAVLFSPAAAVFAMKHTAFGKGFSERLEDLAPGLSAISVGNFNAASSSSDLVLKNPAIQDKLAENPLLAQLFISGDPAGRASDALSGSISNLSDLLVFSMFRMLAFILLFTVVKIAVILLGRLVTLVLGRTLLGAANRTGGMAIGLVIGLMLAYALVMYLIPFLGSVGIVKVPESFAESPARIGFTKLLSLFRGKAVEVE